MKAKLCVVGAGRSGAVTAACLADLGHSVSAVDVDAAQVAKLREGKAPFYEPGLDAVIARNLHAGRLSFTTSFADAVPDAQYVLLCVDTPSGPDGAADLTSYFGALRDLAPLLPEGAVVITRSTVPLGTNARAPAVVREENPDGSFEVAANPEFLREGHAVGDFMRPERVVIGATNDQTATVVARLYDGLNAPVIFTNLETAELIKYASNAYLAASISFINEIANIAERAGADVSLVSQALRLDRRIGRHAYLSPGVGFGGGCLPKDLAALVEAAESHGYSPRMLRSVLEVNDNQPARVLAYLVQAFGEVSGLSVAVLGLSFKGDVFDARSSPALAVVRLLSDRGVRVRVFDPLADETARPQLGKIAELCADPYSAARGCSAIVVATEHSSFRELDLERAGQHMASRLLIDGRNLFDPARVAAAGFSHVAVGRARRSD